MFRFRFDTHSWMIPSVGAPCTVELILWVLSVFRLLVYRIPVYTSNTTRSIYYIVLFQDFTPRRISGRPTVRGTAAIHIITWSVFRSIMMQYFQVLYSGYTLRSRRNWPSAVLLTYSQNSQNYDLQYFSNTQYSQHEVNIIDTPSMIGTFVATPAAALAALAAAAPLAPLMLMCHAL